MIEVYYSTEVQDEALLYYKDGKYLWSDYMAHYPSAAEWHEDDTEGDSVKDTPQVHFKLFEMEE